MSLNHWQPPLAKTKEQYSSHQLHFTSYNAVFDILCWNSNNNPMKEVVFRSQGS